MSNLKKFDSKGNFDEFSNDIDYVKRNVGNVAVSIYKNNEGSIFATDANGNIIIERIIKYTIYTLSYVDSNGNNVIGTMKIFFKDNTVFTNQDGNPDGYWYSIIGMSPFAIKEFK